MSTCGCLCQVLLLLSIHLLVTCGTKYQVRSLRSCLEVSYWNFGICKEFVAESGIWLKQLGKKIKDGVWNPPVQISYSFGWHSRLMSFSSMHYRSLLTTPLILKREWIQVRSRLCVTSYWESQLSVRIPCFVCRILLRFSDHSNLWDAYLKWS